MLLWEVWTGLCTNGSSNRLPGKLLERISELASNSGCVGSQERRTRSSLADRSRFRRIAIAHLLTTPNILSDRRVGHSRCVDRSRKDSARRGTRDASRNQLDHRQHWVHERE